MDKDKSAVELLDELRGAVHYLGWIQEGSLDQFPTLERIIKIASDARDTLCNEHNVAPTTARKLCRNAGLYDE